MPDVHLVAGGSDELALFGVLERESVDQCG